jgi:transposase
MRQKSNSTPASSETLVRNIRRATRKHHAAEEKIRIVLDGLRGETSIAEWSKLRLDLRRTIER